MIPRAHITAWRSRAPWPTDEQVEQDLVLCRALVDMFGRGLIADQAAFRGGTALHKLFLDAAQRYSEDIDLVQWEAGPINALIDAIREALDPWLGAPRWKQGKGRFTLYYRFETTVAPVSTRRLKVEVNTREHFSVLGLMRRRLTIDNPWFRGSAHIPVYQLDELLGTKMRALYQRKKGRDLYDLWLALQSEEAEPERIVHCLERYMEHEGAAVSRAVYEKNLHEKLRSDAFLEDIQLLVAGGAQYDPVAAAAVVQTELVARLSGEPWRGVGPE